LNKELVMTRWILPPLCVVALAVAGCGAPEPAPAPESQPPAASEPPPTSPPSTPPPSTEKPAAEADRPAAAPETPAPPAESPAPPAAADSSKPSAAKHGPGVYAHITTNHGMMVARLFDKEVPRTVENFVGLAEGKKQWRNPRTNSMVRRPYYNNLTFHRIIPGFMIQGGDPEGTGMGGPGYRFDDEFHPKLRHSKAGILSMANAGPNTNGGQFFITLGPTPHLDNRHSVFGELVEGMDTLKEIGSVPTKKPGDMPIDPVVIKSVRIERVS
jgi:peptidyl-prolyl cis-trans isomerase A (cyclophilin A)